MLLCTLSSLGLALVRVRYYSRQSHRPLDLANTIEGVFFLAQTNYDHWLPDPSDDDRYTVASRVLRSLGPSLGPSQLGSFAVVSSHPVWNSDTAYTVVMSPATGELHAFVRSWGNQQSTPRHKSICSQRQPVTRCSQSGYFDSSFGLMCISKHVVCDIVPPLEVR